jgi:hypothetical protein
MFDTLTEIRDAVRSDLSVSANSSLYPEATIDRAINRSYIKASRLFRWPAQEHASYTTTQLNENYYDAPTTWTPDSIWRIEVDGDIYGESPDGSPMKYSDYLKWKEDYPDSTEKKWAVQWLRYFISPTPTVAGLEICIWGQKNVTKLTLDADTTIFSYSLPEGNEAIALEAAAILKKKGDDKDSGGMYSSEAKQILAVAYSHIRKEQGKYEKNLPFFDVPDYYQGNGGPQITGNFTNTRSIGY